MDSTIGFEMSLIVVEACVDDVRFMIPTATFSEIFGRQTNSYILVLLIRAYR